MKVDDCVASLEFFEEGQWHWWKNLNRVDAETKERTLCVARPDVWRVRWW